MTSRLNRLGLIVLLTPGVVAAMEASRPIELGRVDWLRDFDQGRSHARQTSKPIILLFDEVPGCHTCTQFGKGPLSHPLIVDAAETEFVPIAVYNNVKGDDEVILKRYKEPAWNNPVVRFVDSDGRDVIPRKDGVYTTGELASRMVAALKAANRPVPLYLALAEIEYNPARIETATFAMHCYWVGEQKLGDLDGVLATRIGMLDGLEVVEVDFDPTRLSYPALVKNAKKFECAKRVFARTDEQVDVARKQVGDAVARSDEPVDTSTTQQYHLAQSPSYHYLPLTRLQATKVNAAIASQKNPDVFLSPGQIKIHKALQTLMEKHPKVLESLKPDRSPKGLPGYAAQLDRLLRSR